MGLFNFFRNKKPKKRRSAAKQAVNVTVSYHEYTPAELRQQQYDKIEEVRKLQEESIPSRNGLLPHEILMLSYAAKYSNNQDCFPRFWTYEYAVQNPSDLLKKLEREGFIREGTAIESLSWLTLPSLKSILSEQGLKTSGKKADLIDRIKSDVPQSVIESNVSERHYVLTALGEAELKENAYVASMHNKDYGVSVWDVNKALRGGSSERWRDAVWGELNCEQLDAAKYLSNGNVAPMTSVMYRQVDFLKDEGRIDQAITIVIYALSDEIGIRAPEHFLLDKELYEKGIDTSKQPSFYKSVKDYSDFGFSLLDDLLGLNAQKGINPDASELCMRLSSVGNVVTKSEFVDLVSAKLSHNQKLFHDICDNIQRRIC